MTDVGELEGRPGRVIDDGDGARPGRPNATLPSPVNGWPKPSTVSPQTDVVVPTAATVMSPLEMTAARLPPPTGAAASVAAADAEVAAPLSTLMLPSSWRRLAVSRFRSLPGAAVTTTGTARRCRVATSPVDTRRRAPPWCAWWTAAGSTAARRPRLAEYVVMRCIWPAGVMPPMREGPLEKPYETAPASLLPR